MKPTVISTFAGAGGSSLGYKLAGFHELLAVEWEDDAASTFRRNFPDVTLHHGDITKLSVDQCLQEAGIEAGQLDVFDGSPPCQGFSTAGKRRVDDPRNTLFEHYVRLLRGLQPKVLVMENVAGMVRGEMKPTYLRIMECLRDSGYNCRGQLLNAMHFNVPQSRERVIIIGVRNDLKIAPSHPKPQTHPIPFGIAVAGCPVDQEQRLTNDVVRRYAALHPGGWSTNTRLYKQVKGNDAGAFSLKWAEWHRVCQTIAKSEISLTGIVHPNRDRYLSASEMKRVASFPDDFWFSSRDNAVARIGNSVPPNLMRAIATHIRQVILNR